ncbi:MAG: hypothetical protein Edafosvirus11_18 [Edafosvirus sp.]|uniref:Uncharacterized protein n=1 Tax=Edafosvirus sp. TaxID=2487765 RepID=A0A3G4ZXR0_9VIRU|nr:MAG: hypothetical protein Edafosvirus11_18 [Edafosvirus sp.]
MKDLRNKFMKDYELYPSFFGYPEGVRKSDEEKRFPEFLQAYIECYGKDKLNEMEVEYNGVEKLIELLKSYSPTNKLTVICMSPLHEIALIPVDLFPNMHIVAMNGGFEEDPSKKTINIPKAGNNGGICPGITDIVFKKLTESKTAMTLISSGLVRRKNCVLPLNIYNKWIKLLESDKVSKFTKAFFKDFEFCNHGNKLANHKNLCDPLTLYLAIFGNYKSYKVKTTINCELKILDYLKVSKEGNIFNMVHCEDYNTELVYDFNQNVCIDIVDRIENILFPYHKFQYPEKN